jgi:hypothetical protein
LTFKNQPGEAMPGDPDALSGDSEVHSITDAATPHSEEMRQRMIKYAVAMGIRMVCLILIFAVDGWFKLVPALGAVFLPWVAVIIANGGDKAEIHSDALLDYVPMSELEPPAAVSRPASEPGAAGAEDASMTLLQGELMHEEDGIADDEGDHGRAAS